MLISINYFDMLILLCYFTFLYVGCLLYCCRWKTGQIFVFTELLNVTETDSQLAVVLSHEISHALLSHSVCSFIIVHQLLIKFSCKLHCGSGVHILVLFTTLK